MTFQIHFTFTAAVMWSRPAVFQAWCLQSNCLKPGAYVISIVVRSKCQAVARSFPHSRKGCRLLYLPTQHLQLSAAAPVATGMLSKISQSWLIPGPEAYWHASAWIPTAKIPYSSTQSSRTWIAFGYGSQPMLALAGVAWETPHRHAPKIMPRKDCADNLMIQTVLVLFSFLG